MNSKFIVKLAMTTFAIGASSVVSTNISVTSAASATPAEIAAKKANKMALKAEKQLAKGRVEAALPLAEMAVEGDPQNREYREMLSRIYMAQGRFQSAERTLMDVMELGQADGRTVISLALVRIAQGHTGSAIALVDGNKDIIPASDYGLALALAGQSERGIEVLSGAIRADNANARTRQNLALAYAIGGRWREARVMASQDMPEPQVNDRIAEWAQYARPGAYETRVAGLLKVTPQNDPGQPVRLALNAAGSSSAMAMAMPEPPAPIADNVGMANNQLAAVGPAPVASNAGFNAAAAEGTVAMPAMASAPLTSAEAPLIKAQQGPTKTQMAMTAMTVKPAVSRAIAAKPAVSKANAAKPAVAKSVAAKPAVAPVKRPVKLALADTAPQSAPVRQVSGSHLVQLGAFSSAASAKQAWEKLYDRYSVLQGFKSASSSVTVNGKTFVRLAAMGFGNLETAQAACQSIKSKGGDCIVRSLNGNQQPVRLAAKKAIKVAARKPVRIASR
jgi:D-alanyl-D-alanine carboxypeptidase